MSDEDVVQLAKSGHVGATEFLITRYRSLVETKAKSYFVLGADREDVIQEGMIGLYKAIRGFRNESLHKFRPFAELCVTRQIITAVKTATRHKHVPLNAYVSIERGMYSESSDVSLADVLPTESTGRTDRSFMDRKLPSNIQDLMHGSLSDLERVVLRCYLEGLSYSEMSREVSCPTKSVDNALQRVKRKIALLLKE